MLVFCDESWKANGDGKKVGTLSAVAIPAHAYNAIEDRVFHLKEKYFGLENARAREAKGKQLLSHYEYKRESGGEVSITLSFARELLEEMRFQQFNTFASVVFAEAEVDLLCEDTEKLDRPYVYLMERVEFAVRERGQNEIASLVFDDRGIMQNQRVSEAFRNFLTRSKTGRSYSNLIRTPFFAYSASSTGLQLADLVCTVVNRFYTERQASPRIPEFFSIVRSMQWTAKEPLANGHLLQGIKILGG